DINARVIDIHTIKPIDRDIIIKAAKETGCIVTAEEHTIVGGFGSAVAEVVCSEYPVPVKMVGIEDKFGKSGNPYQLLELYGLTAENIAAKAIEAIQML
ncbi:MAG TPA: transketolase C-terminal domain-containing protein, partial [Thermoclostridium sp.]|nr:transketolase C-terminal domain-containing protein [Thermoclostridium sp.]